MTLVFALRWLRAALVLLAGPAGAAELAVVSASLEPPPVEVMAGDPVPLFLTCGADAAPVGLEAELLAVTGTMVARVRAGLALSLTPVSATEPGGQRFRFEVETPALARRQEFLLRVRLKLAGGGSATIPAVRLRAEPRTWRDALSRFARDYPCGRVGTDERLAAIFAALPSETPAHDDPLDASADAAVRVWLAVADRPDFTIPAAPVGAVWVVFKPDVGGCVVQRSSAGGSLYVAVDVRALERPDHDPTSQRWLEQALAQARVLAGDVPFSP